MRKLNIYNFEQLKEFIREKNIKSRTELHNKFSAIWKNSFCLLKEDEKNILLPLLCPSYEYLNTKSEFKQFFEKNNIISRSDLLCRFEKCHARFIKLLTKEEQEEILPSLKPDYTCLKTKYDFKQFIENNNIKSRKDLGIRFNKVGVKFNKLLTKEERDEILPPLRKDFSNLIDYENFKIFIEDNNILSRKDFKVRFAGAYRRFKNRLTNKEKDLLLSTINGSLGEKFLCRLFSNNSIVFETEKTYEDLYSKNNVKLRYDFYLPEYGILVEYHGEQHFNPDDNFYTKDGIKRDKQKFEYAKLNNISILYFTNEVEVYEKFGYFTEVITDSDILIEKIKEIKISLTN